MTWIFIIAILVIIGFLLDRELYYYEGPHFGPYVQAWLYDRWSKKYDKWKHASQVHDDEMLVSPLLNTLQATALPEPFILDFATGTGRLSSALLDRSDFNGHLIALDISQGMLEQAALKLNPHSTRVELIRHVALPLPFPDATFDVVCALEVLELFSNMAKPVAELARVLRPGGILLTSRATKESGRKAAVKTEEEFSSLLAANNFEQIQLVKWWKYFDRVIGVKSGSSIPMGARKLSDVLCCRKCGQAQWQIEPGMWKCQNCGNELQVTKEGIILN